MIGDNDFSIQGIILASVITPIIVSLITAVVYNKFYFKLNKNRLQEELKFQDCPQVSVHYINSLDDLDCLIEQAYECVNHTISFDVSAPLDGMGEQKVQCRFKQTELGALEYSSNWVYIYIKNNSNVEVSLLEIIDRQEVSINICNNWNKHLITAKTGIGLLARRYDKPTKVVLNFKGYILEYKIDNPTGPLRFKLR